MIDRILLTSYRTSVWVISAAAAVCLVLVIALTSCVSLEEQGKNGIGSSDIPANLIAASGHGMYLDRHGNSIDLDDALRSNILASMIDVLRPVAEDDLPEERKRVLVAAQQLLNDEQLPIEHKLLLQTGIVGNLLEYTPIDYLTEYQWRFRLLLPRAYSVYGDVLADPRFLDDEILFPRLLEGLDIASYLDLLDDLTEPTDYAGRCREAGVPVPEYWSESPDSGWRLQGSLTENLLDPGAQAFVWTWADNEADFSDAVFGGCIALPRDDGGTGTLAGIICQGAVSGNACFWDNKLKSDPTQRAIGWRDMRLVLDDLHNGDSLLQDCTRCHRGDNVFIISPDDQTWQDTINRTRSSGTGRAFVTNHILELYTPISAQRDPAMNKWVNAPTDRESSCSVACHASAPGASFPPPAMMPPACSLLPGTGVPDPTWCYRGP